MYLLLIVFLAVLLPIAEGFLLAFLAKQNEGDLLALLGWSPAAVEEDEKRMQDLLSADDESVVDGPADQANAESQSQIDPDQATEFVSNLLEDDEANDEAGSDETRASTEETVEGSEAFDDVSSDQMEAPPLAEDVDQASKEADSVEEPSAESSENEAFDEMPEKTIDPSQAGFEDSEQLSQALAEGGVSVDEAFEEMFSDREPTISPDLERRIEENENLEEKLARLEKEEEGSEQNDGISEEDILNEEATEQDKETKPLFNEIDDPQDESEQISSMAKELLGEDFDFDVLAEQQLGIQTAESESGEHSDEMKEFDESVEPSKVEENDRSFAENVREVEPEDERETEPETDSEGTTIDSEITEDDPTDSVSVCQIADGVFQTLSDPGTPLDSSLLAQLTVDQDILPSFPEELIQDSFIMPDCSEAAKQNSFVEASRPMFARRKKTGGD